MSRAKNAPNKHTRAFENRLAGPRRVAFVVPRYGPEVLGGAETFARNFAEHLTPDEFCVTVLTTCARDLLTWQNEYPPGEVTLDQVRVIRFPVALGRRDTELFQSLTNRFNRGEPATLDDQVSWLEQSAHSPGLYAHLARHGTSYDLMIFMPYLFGTTIYGSALWPDKSVICPCLHDEPYASFSDVRLMLQSARGLMFLSAPEQTLAERRLGVRHPAARLIGVGMDPLSADGERFRGKFGLTGSFVLYAGRLDPMKNVMQLFSHFMAYCEARPESGLKLVLAGSGPLPVPQHPDIVHVGYLSSDDLHDACAAATVLCQPSLVESFSIVLMEAWLARKPVLVHGHCPVTRHHVLQSNGGLYYASAEEFAATLDWLLNHRQQLVQMGEQGRSYVLREFNWPTVLDRFRAAVRVWTAQPPLP
jgi:glycosyltransferase involved in cell wall biosynthesis